MKEIRLCWSCEVSHEKHEIQTTSIWQPSSPALLRDFEIMVEAGNELYGAGTHWVEEREMPGA